MLKDELGKLRKLIKSAEHGEGTYEAIYKKLDRIEHILQEDSEQDEEEEFTPSHYIKPIQGLLDTYQKSLEKLKHQNRKLMAGQGLQQNNSNVNEHQRSNPQPAARKQAITMITPNQPMRHTSGQRSASSTQAKTIKQLDEQILYLTNEIRNTLR